MRNNYVYRFLILAAAAVLLVSCSRARQERTIAWMTDVDQGLALAADQGKPVMIDFMAVWCPPCHKMEDSTFTHPEVVARSFEFVSVRIDVDQQAEVANQYNGNASKYGGVGIPNVLFLDSEGNELRHPVGYIPPEKFLAVMDSVLILNKKQQM